ncbi:cell division protein FtsQ/DivIB [Oscillospiraceae bacterium LTW-04]|nr:FtsQ-type POTRA domain-containing protein [Oscillospiraceae bacterium MB24-C1]
MGRKRQDEKHAAYGRAARRRKRSKKKYTLYYLLALILMLCIGVALSLTVFFKIESIQVVGDTRYAKEELIDVAGIRLGENLFRVSQKETSEKLIAGYPYIAQVRLQRVLPNSLLLHVAEAQPKAAIETGQAYMLLDERARVLETDLPVCPEDYFRVVGFSAKGLSPGEFLSEQDQERLGVLLELQMCITANGLSKIRLADLSDIANIWLLYDGRVAIELGGQLDVDYKIRAAKSIIDVSVTDTTVGTLDVSTRPAMRLRERNIYDKHVWPFPESLIDDYERVVPKNNWLVDAPSSATPENSVDSTSSAVGTQIASGN